MALLDRRALAAALALVFAGSAQAQTFIDNQTDIPTGGAANSSASENVDFGDVDNDGDWDAIFADGGDDADDRNRIWINQGGAQGGTLGVFSDETMARFPMIQDRSRDIEFADIDQDGDLDIYVSNTSVQVNQSNRWWINQGGLQGGTIGVYVDETLTRWVGLGGPGSSIDSSALLAGGGFTDWSCDCDFGDLDNDGDLDLVHSSYGGAFGGNVPTRIFLNDGDGFFSEFNPSGFQLNGSDINNGNPGIWCDGTQSANTTNASGNNCDIASSALDIDLGDIDGDFDLDILHGARQELPRMYANRLEASNLAPANGGNLGFRDVTGMVFPNGYSTGDGHYEQEMGDLDGDGDLDIYGLNWLAQSFTFTDVTLRNTGNGVYDNITVLTNSDDDDNEGDFLDYDNDGDLDLFVADFSSRDRLYRNNNNGGADFSFTDVTSGNVPSLFFVSLDADAADMDGDGDYDVLAANDNGARNVYYQNIRNTPDTSAPYMPNVEQAPDRMAGPDSTVIRAHVYDNAPYYITFYNPTQIEYEVNGGSTNVVPMRSSGGQIFRGEIPGTEVGTITYRIVSSDEHGNTGMSATSQYDSMGAGTIGTPYCTASLNSTGSGGQITATGSTLASPLNLTLTAQPVPNTTGLFFFGPNQLGAEPDFGEGVRCVGGATSRIFPLSGGSGNVATQVLDGNAGYAGAIVMGASLNFQYWFRETMNAGDLDGDGMTEPFNTSNAVNIVYQ